MDVALFDHYLEARDGLEGFKSLLDAKPDLVVCDLEMPRMDGFKFLKMVNTRKEFSNIPIIILTGSLNQEVKVKGLEQGACDYVTKPFDAAELVARVKVHLKTKMLQDDLEKAIQHYKALSVRDPLTSLYNRRYFTEIIDKEFERAERNHDFLSLVIFDIDHFKKINDLYGHQNGDTVLVDVANVALKGLRTYDEVARYGGDEFVLVLPGTPLSGGMLVAERLREAVQALTFAPPMEHLSLTISLGVATYPSPQVDSITSLFRLADYSLYQAKHNGRNRVETADEILTKQSGIDCSELNKLNSSNRIRAHGNVLAPVLI
jgi:two-component system cell cycle response regulator